MLHALYEAICWDHGPSSADIVGCYAAIRLFATLWGWRGSGGGLYVHSPHNRPHCNDSYCDEKAPFDFSNSFSLVSFSASLSTEMMMILWLPMPILPSFFCPFHFSPFVVSLSLPLCCCDVTVIVWCHWLLVVFIDSTLSTVWCGMCYHTRFVIEWVFGPLSSIQSVAWIDLFSCPFWGAMNYNLPKGLDPHPFVWIVSRYLLSLSLCTQLAYDWLPILRHFWDFMLFGRQPKWNVVILNFEMRSAR